MDCCRKSMNNEKGTMNNEKGTMKKESNKYQISQIK